MRASARVTRLSAGSQPAAGSAFLNPRPQPGGCVVQGAGEAGACRPGRVAACPPAPLPPGGTSAERRSRLRQPSPPLPPPPSLPSPPFTSSPPQGRPLPAPAAELLCRTHRQVDIKDAPKTRTFGIIES